MNHRITLWKFGLAFLAVTIICYQTYAQSGDNYVPIVTPDQAQSNPDDQLPPMIQDAPGVNDNSLPPIVVAPATADAVINLPPIIQSDNGVKPDSMRPVISAPVSSPYDTEESIGQQTGSQYLPPIVSSGEILKTQLADDSNSDAMPDMPQQTAHFIDRPNTDNNVEVTSAWQDPGQDYARPIDTTLPATNLPPVMPPQATQDIAFPPASGEVAIGNANGDVQQNELLFGAGTQQALPSTDFLAPNQGSGDSLKGQIDTQSDLVQPAVQEFPLNAQPGTNDYFDQETAVSGTSECGCGGTGCDLCNGGSETVYDADMVAACFECCGFVSCAKSYLIVDYLYYDRSGDRALGGNVSGFEDFTWSSGGRVQYGRRWDVNTGIEYVFTGFDPWIAVTQRRSASNSLQGNLFASGGLPFSSLSAFRNANFLENFHKTDLYSGEINRTYWGWDVVKTLVGFRYTYFDSEYRKSTARQNGQRGLYLQDNTNYMFGPQVGMELFYDIGYKLSFSASAKLAGYVNLSRGHKTVINDGRVVLNNFANDTSFSASGDLGAYLHYQVQPNIRFRAGLEFLSLWRVATTVENYTRTITPTTGLRYSQGDSTAFTGFSAGLEIYR